MRNVINKILYVYINRRTLFMNESGMLGALDPSPNYSKQNYGWKKRVF